MPVKNTQLDRHFVGDSVAEYVCLQVTFPSSMPYPFYSAPGLARTDGHTFNPVQPNVDIGAGMMRTQISLTVQGQQQFDTANETLGARFVAVIAWLRSPR